jgi:hypothetical protein
MAGNYQKLADELEKLEYAEMTPEEIYTALTTPEPVTISRRVDERDILREWGDPNAANAFIEKLEAAAASNKIVERALKWMAPNQGGLDVGDPSVIAMIEALATAEVITEVEAATFKGLAVVNQTRAERYGLGRVKVGYITKALRILEE